LLTPKQPTVTVLGYYGFNNLGDDLLLATFLQCLEQLSTDNAIPVTIQILSQQPGDTQKTYPQTMCFHRIRPMALVQALRRSQWLVLGGGGLFQDATSLKNVVYYAGMVLLARCLGNRVVWWAQGVGPLHHWLSRWLTGVALKASQTISVRDARSEQLVHQLAPGKPVHTVVDPVWLLQPISTGQGDVAPGAIGVSLRAWPSLTDAGIDQLAEMIDKVFPLEQPVVLLPFQPAQDNVPLTRLQALNPERPVRWATGDMTRHIADLAGLVGMRFHAIVMAVLHQVPVMAIGYDPKVEQLCNTLGLPCLTPDQLPTMAHLHVALADPPALVRINQQARQNKHILQPCLSSS
jgi:polysaccharide pyruvyl transferase CsaB